MKRTVRNIGILMLIFLLIFSFASCGDSGNGGTQSAEISSVSEISYIAEEQGIAIMSAYRFQSDVEGETLAGNEPIAGVVVINNSDRTMQYAVITGTFSDGSVYTYTVSTIPPGETCHVQEYDSQPYRPLDHEFVGFEISSVAFFETEPSVYDGTLQFSGADGILTVKNVSGSDIENDISVYYKTCINGQLIGGRTYRVTVEGGLKNGEITQIPAGHFNNETSVIMFVQIAPAEVE